MAAWLLSYFLGWLGVDRFYLGYIGTGILKLITFGGFGIWWLIDLVMILSGSKKDKKGLPLAERNQYLKLSVIVTIGLLVLGSISAIVFHSSYTNLIDSINNGKQDAATLNSYYLSVSKYAVSLSDDLTATSADIKSQNLVKLQTDCSSINQLNTGATFSVPNTQQGTDFNKIKTDANTIYQDCEQIISSNFSSASITQFGTDSSTLSNDAVQLQQDLNSTTQSAN